MRQAKLYFFILWFHTKFLSRSTVNMIERLKLLSIFKYKKGISNPFKKAANDSPPRKKKLMNTGMISKAELREPQRQLDFGSDNTQICVPLTDTFLFTVPS